MKKIRGFPLHEPRGPRPPDIVEEFIANVVDLELGVLMDVKQFSKYSIELKTGVYEVKLDGRRRIGILDEAASAWALTRRRIGARTHSWSAEPGAQFLKIVLRASA